MKKKVTFLLPGIANRPIGGYKVVYEYANRLVEDGFDVDIVYPAYLYVKQKSWIVGFVKVIKACLKFLYCTITKMHSCKGWFELDKRVKECLRPALNEVWCPKSDVIFATSVRTAFYLNEYKRTSSKFYLIQAYEAWQEITDERLIETYKYPLKKIVISKWLYDIVSQYDAGCQLIPNGFDFEFFKRTVKNEERDKYRVAMMYHTLDLKGCDDGFAALNLVKRRYPELKVSLFGVYPAPENLPDWITYYRQPGKELLNEIYNTSAIFIATSWSEGWGLTVGEAMMCGCAVACTDNDGYKEMAIDGTTALLSPIKNPVALAENIIKLIENDSLRFELSEHGYENIKKFNWEDSYSKLKSCLN